MAHISIVTPARAGSRNGCILVKHLPACQLDGEILRKLSIGHEHLQGTRFHYLHRRIGMRFHSQSIPHLRDLHTDRDQLFAARTESQDTGSTTQRGGEGPAPATSATSVAGASVEKKRLICASNMYDAADTRVLRPFDETPTTISSPPCPRSERCASVSCSTNAA